MASAPVFKITYWGATGSFAAPLTPAEVMAKLGVALRYLAENRHLEALAAVAKDPARIQHFLQQNLPFHLRSTFGGNTTCVEIQTPDVLLILDCGTGFRVLGTELERRWNAADFRGRREAHVLITHAHMDHTLATPFFDPYMDPRNEFTLYGSTSVMKSIDVVLSPTSPLSRMYVPITFDLFKAIRRRVNIEGNQEFAIGSTTIKTVDLRHPGGCLGFRFECQGRSFVFCTDHEQIEAPDPLLTAFARGADLLYSDGQYLAAEYEGKVGVMSEAPLARRGWGHSSVEVCVATAVAAGVKQMHVGHREPKRDDTDLAKFETYLQQCMAERLRQIGRDETACAACVPYEGMTVEI